MDLSELKQLRKKLNLTQAELAQKSNVSQSLIAKIESGNIDPSYSNAIKIINTLQNINNTKEITAKDIMHKKIIFLDSKQDLKSAIDLMRKHNISQMPVEKNDKVIGFISESTLIDKILDNNNYNEISEIMEDVPPILPLNTNMSALAGLLKYFPFILIKDKEKIVGIITKSDLLKYVIRDF